jgi:hypothetical protein
MANWWTTHAALVNMVAVGVHRRPMVQRLWVASPGVVLAAIGVVVFTVHLTNTDDSMSFPGVLIWGLVGVVLVRLVLGMVSADHVGLAILGTCVGMIEMLVLVRSTPNTGSGEFGFNELGFVAIGFVVFGLADLALITLSWLATRAVRRAQRNRAD